jgi:hypothetical protein
MVKLCGFTLIKRYLIIHSSTAVLPEHLSSPTVLSGVGVTRSLILCVCLVDRCLSFCTFSFGHFSSIYEFWSWLPLWYLVGSSCSTSEVRAAQSLVCYVVCCWSLFVILSFFIWSLYCFALHMKASVLQTFV